MNDLIDRYIPEIDFNTDKIIFVVYPPGAGGNFLASALGLSDSAVFMNAVLAKKQLDNNFSTDDKINYITDYFSKMKPGEFWEDMGFGNKQLYGNFNGAIAETQQSVNYLITESIISEVIKQDKYFFCSVHSLFLLPLVLRNWKNANAIVFYNCDNFVMNRPSLNRNNKLFNKRVDYWNIVRSKIYPKTPPNNINEFMLLDSIIKNELLTNFGSEIIYMLDDYQYNSKKIKTALFNESDSYKSWDSKLSARVQLWNADWFFNQDKTIDNITKLYKDYRMGSVPVDNLIKYYQLWNKCVTKHM
jgi:hypothetical protein